MVEKKVRIILETNSIRFGYEKIEKTDPEPKPLTHVTRALVPLLKGGKINYYV